LLRFFDNCPEKLKKKWCKIAVTISNAQVTREQEIEAQTIFSNRIDCLSAFRD